MKSFITLFIVSLFLLNLSFIESYSKAGELVLTDGTKVEVSRRKKEYVQGALREIGL